MLSESEVEARVRDTLTDFSNDVGQDQSTRRLQERLDREDATANGGGNTLAESNGSNEFCDCRQAASLNESQGLRADRGGIRVGDIIGANAPDREAEEDDTNGKEPVEIVQCRHGCLKMLKQREGGEQGTVYPEIGQVRANKQVRV